MLWLELGQGEATVNEGSRQGVSLLLDCRSRGAAGSLQRREAAMALEAIEACSGVVHPVDLEVNAARSWANSRSKRGSGPGARSAGTPAAMGGA